MNKSNYTIKLLTFLFPLFCLAQTGTIKGVILNEFNQPVDAVNIKSGDFGTQTNVNGFFEIKITANTEVKVIFSHVSHKNITATFNLKNGETLEFNPVLKENVEQISTVVIN